MKITCEYTYESAHSLPYVPVDHQCHRLHGHSYRLLVTVAGPVDDNGWVIDFADVKATVAPHLALLDHHHLNKVPGLENPTVEIQLQWWWDFLSLDLPSLHSLTLYEGYRNHATYEGPEYE